MARQIRAYAAAARRRIARLLGRAADPFADTPPGLNLSPSDRHFCDYRVAPLRLHFSSETPDDVLVWQQRARSQLAVLAGYSRQDALPTVMCEDERSLPDGRVRRRVYLRVREGVDVPLHVIAPTVSSDGAPRVMLCLQGTNSGAHISWGEVRVPADHEKSRADYAFALQAAQNGYVAIAVEQSCFGERAERNIRPRSAAPCVDATMHALLLGRSLLGERCSDISAVIDWLVRGRGLGAAPETISIMGHSAGGSVALYAAALDDRLSAVLASGCVGMIRNTIARRRDNQGQNVIPGILNWLEMDDIAGLVAPRRLAIVACEADPIWPAQGAREVFKGAREIYAALGTPDRIGLRCLEGGHRFHPDPAWSTLDAVLGTA